MNSYRFKIYTETPEECEYAQQLVFQLGITWNSGSGAVFYTNEAPLVLVITGSFMIKRTLKYYGSKEAAFGIGTVVEPNIIIDLQRLEELVEEQYEQFKPLRINNITSIVI